MTPPASHDGKTKGRMKVHLLALEAGKEYVISLNSNAFDAYLRLLNPMGAVVAEDDDSGGNLNARITYRAAQTGQFRIIATSFDGKLGPYQLTVVEVQPPDKGPITKENKEFPQAKDPNAAFEVVVIVLDVKFGQNGRRLLPRVRALEDVAALRSLSRVLQTATTLDEVRELLPRGPKAKNWAT